MFTHKHHIIPKHMGGTDDPSNLIELTVEEHAEAHHKLYEQYGDKKDLLAYKGLLGTISKKEILKELCSHRGENNPMFGKFGADNPNYGKKRTKESKEKISSSLKSYASNRKHTHENNLRTSLYSKETSEKRRMSISRNWEVTFPDGEKIIIKNISEWCLKNGFNKSTVSCSAKKGNSHRGYFFRKLDK